MVAAHPGEEVDLLRVSAPSVMEPMLSEQAVPTTDFRMILPRLLLRVLWMHPMSIFSASAWMSVSRLNAL